MQYWECFCYDATFNVLSFLWRTKAVINNSQVCGSHQEIPTPGMWVSEKGSTSSYAQNRVGVFVRNSSSDRTEFHMPYPIRSEKKTDYDKNGVITSIPSPKTLEMRTRNGIVIRPWSITIPISPKSIIGDGTLRSKKDGFTEHDQNNV